jgi:large subunit ribosomal protein LP1
MAWRSPCVHLRYGSRASADALPQADKINALTTAAGIEVEPIWATLLAKALEGKNVKDLLSNVGSGGGAPVAAGGAAPAAGGGGAAPAEEKKEEKKEEEKEESDDDMVRAVRPARTQHADALLSPGLRSLRLSLSLRVSCSPFLCYMVALCTTPSCSHAYASHLCGPCQPLSCTKPKPTSSMRFARGSQQM